MTDPATAPPPARRFTGVRAKAAAGGEGGESGSGAAAADATPSTSTSTALAPAPPPAGPRRFVRQQIPDDILHDPALAAAASALPPNYAFELPKTIWRLRGWGSKKPALQFPEGLLLFATTLADIIAAFVPGCAPLILGDVAYGACCVDDRAAAAAGADALVHYGHSCLVPAPSCVLPVLYVFVDVGADADHLVRSVVAGFSGGVPTAAVGGGGGEGGGGQGGRGGVSAPAAAPPPPPPPPAATPTPSLPHLALAGTIQFGSTVAAAAAGLRAAGFRVSIPQARPLSPGEVLGCTAPRLGGAGPAPPRRRGDVASEGGGEAGGGGGGSPPHPDALVFVADGRFHMEALMIANPALPAFRYCPYGRTLTRESYDHAGMRAARAAAVRAARASLRPAAGGGERGGRVCWGLALSTLGRQGSSSRLVARLSAAMRARGVRPVTVLVSEVTPAKIGALCGRGGGGQGGAASGGPTLGAWVQVACPRLSIDWGEGFAAPVLTPYEALVALGAAPGWWAGEGEGGAGGSAAGGCGECGGGGGGSCGSSSIPTDAEALAARPYPMDFYAADGGAWGAWHGLKD